MALWSTTLRIRSEYLDDQLHDHAGRVELATLLAGVVGELLDQVLVCAAEHVGLGEVRVADVELREVLNKTGEDGVSVSSVAKLSLVVVVDASEHSFETCILLFERRAGLVEGVADVGRRFLDLRPSRPLGNEELVLVDVLRIGALFDQRFALFVEAVSESLQEEQPENVVFVVGRVDRPAEDVGGGPKVAFELIDRETIAGRDFDRFDGGGCRTT